MPPWLPAANYLAKPGSYRRAFRNFRHDPDMEVARALDKYRSRAAIPESLSHTCSIQRIP
jgi:hypothetical protein